MPLVDLDDPEELRARWSALAAVAHATGYDSRWWADADGWHHEDGAGNELVLVELDQARAVLFGLHREYSRTVGSDLLVGAPDWIALPAVRERIGRGELGFVYANFSGTWARAAYPGDPWQPLDDGFLPVGSWLTSDEEAAAELVEWAAEWADHLGSLDELRVIGQQLVRSARSTGLGSDELLELFDRLEVGPHSARHPDLQAALAAAARFGSAGGELAGSAPEEEQAPGLARPGFVATGPSADAGPSEVGSSAAGAQPDAPRVGDTDADDFYASLFADAPAAATYVPDVQDPVVPDPGEASRAAAEPAWQIDEATCEFFPFALDDQREPPPGSAPDATSEAEPDYGGDPLGFRWTAGGDPSSEQLADAPAAGEPPPPDDGEEDDFDLASLANLPPPGAADRRYSRYERKHGLAAPIPGPPAPDDEPPAAMDDPSSDGATVRPAGAAGLAALIPGLADYLDDEHPVDVPADSLEAAMRAEQERPRPRPARSAPLEALHAWCRARTRIVPSGFTIQVQVLDPAAPSYRFDLEPPVVEDPQFAAERLAGLLSELWMAEAAGEQGGWLFARIDAAGRTVRIDRWYDQIPDWWDDPVVERIDVRGLRRRLNGRAADWQPSYLERLRTGAR